MVSLAHASALSDLRVGDISLDSVWTAFPIALAGIVVWALWLYRVILSRRARPVVNDFRTSTSVVVPSFHEDPDILLRCLDSWLRQDPTEVIIVLDVEDTEAQRRILELNDSRVRAVMFKHAGKRSALGVGIRLATSHVVVLVDSDTFWQPGLLASVQMPFFYHDVGGVSTQQNVFDRAHQRLAPGRRLAGRPALLRLRARHGRGRRSRLPVRSDGRLPPRGDRPGARAPRERVLPRPPLHRR